MDIKDKVLYLEAALKVADKMVQAVFAVSDSLDKVASAIEDSK